MIIDLENFISTGRPHWEELEQLLRRFETADANKTITDAQRLHYLYERVSADLNKLTTFANEPETRRYLENLVARSYSEIHAGRMRGQHFRPLHWFFNTFPRTFRKHIRAFQLTVVITLVGCVFGWFAVQLDPAAKSVLLPFGHGDRDPRERVQKEEERFGENEDHLAGRKAHFSAHLMTHNTRVSINAMALGTTWGLGTIILLFYNGVIMGGIIFDYVNAELTEFLLAWLLPHGSIEIPAILLAGQAGLVLGGGMIGWGRRVSLRERMRKIAPDLVTLIGGVAIMLVWAGIIEAFFSQYHEPVLPYEIKIAFGCIELVALIYFLSRCGTKEKTDVG